MVVGSRYIVVGWIRLMAWPDVAHTISEVRWLVSCGVNLRTRCPLLRQFVDTRHRLSDSGWPWPTMPLCHCVLCTFGWLFYCSRSLFVLIYSKLLFRPEMDFGCARRMRVFHSSLRIEIVCLWPRYRYRRAFEMHYMTVAMECGKRVCRWQSYNGISETKTTEFQFNSMWCDGINALFFSSHYLYSNRMKAINNMEFFGRQILCRWRTNAISKCLVSKMTTESIQFQCDTWCWFRMTDGRNVCTRSDRTNR